MISRGRSTAPNALSIWLHNIKGLEFHDDLKPAGSDKTLRAALTYAAGENHKTAFDLVHARGHMLNVGGGPSVGPAGYALGGGHSLISHKYGLAADNIHEAYVVKPDGTLVVANEVQNAELF
jgi:hypothetical protein